MSTITSQRCLDESSTKEEWGTHELAPVEEDKEWILYPNVPHKHKRAGRRFYSRWSSNRKCEQEPVVTVYFVNELEQEFNALADEWESETRNTTSPKAIEKHPAIRKIIMLGEDVVPLILRRMEHHPWFWFGPLMELTKEKVDPINPSMYGDMQRMTEAWIEWGIRRGKIN